jgi:alpha-L-fucosidase 2
MHYWPAEVGNLPECHVPWMNGVSQILRPSGRRTAMLQYQCRGWTADAISNAWGYSACGWGGWTPFVTGGTWIASHLWSHYLYTGDKQFLADQAYPTLKENAEFFVDYVVRHPKYGWFVTGPSVSPENSFIAPDGKQTSWSMSPTVDAVLLNQLFNSCIAANEILNVDKPFREKLLTLRDNLPPFKVGRHGQLQEWLEDYEDAIPGHRHTCPLLAIYPFALITPNSTPELAKAAEVTIQRRVTNPRWEDHGWSRALLAIQLARLGKGEAAYEHLQKYIKTFVYQNLLDFAWGGHTGTRYPIFCLDGNGGFATAVSEMLLQSYHGEIRLLPSLPKAWPNGHLTGMCAEGGFEVAETWKNGRLL